MKILVYGAGVIGSVFAARLHSAGQDVTLLARGKRLLDLRERGIVLEEASKGQHTTQISVIEQLGTADAYDLVIVSVRMDQLESVLPVLAANTHTPNVLFMLNNPTGAQHLSQVLSPERVVLGFPGVGGARRGDAMRYILIAQQPTTLGELDDHQTPRLEEVANAFRSAGFPTVFNRDMQSWLKTHAVFVACVAAALTLSGGDSVQLSKTRPSVATMIQAIREGFCALQALKVQITPPAIKIIFTRMPKWFAILYWQYALRTTTGTLAMAPHANTARDEMRLLAVEVLTLTHTSSIQTPTLDWLLHQLTVETLDLPTKG